MPKGPNGQKRPADVIGAAVMVAKIATGEIEETPVRKPQAKGAAAGGAARAAALSGQQRTDIARSGAAARAAKRK